MAKMSFNAQMGIRFRKITSDYAKINNYIQETAVMILEHSLAHGDCSTAQGLVNAMPQSARKLALINWFAAYSPIVVKDDPKWQSKMHKETSKLYVPFDIEAAKATPWFAVAEDMGKEGKVFDFDQIMKLVQALSARIDKKLKDGEIPEADVASAKAASVAISGLKLVRVDGKEVGNDTKPVPQEQVVDEPAGLKAVA